MFWLPGLALRHHYVDILLDAHDVSSLSGAGKVVLNDHLFVFNSCILLYLSTCTQVHGQEVETLPAALRNKGPWQASRVWTCRFGDEGRGI